MEKMKGRLSVQCNAKVRIVEWNWDPLIGSICPSVCLSVCRFDPTVSVYLLAVPHGAEDTCWPCYGVMDAISAALPRSPLPLCL